MRGSAKPGGLSVTTTSTLDLEGAAVKSRGPAFRTVVLEGRLRRRFSALSRTRVRTLPVLGWPGKSCAD